MSIIGRQSNAFLIANPAAGRGRGARRLPQVREALAAVGITDVRLTKHGGHERDLAAQAANEGIETIAALGGDGTWGNVARGILDSGRDARMVAIAGGTGYPFSDRIAAFARRSSTTGSRLAPTPGGRTTHRGGTDDAIPATTAARRGRRTPRFDMPRLACTDCLGRAARWDLTLPAPALLGMFRQSFTERP